MSAVATEVLKRKKNALIVGHSNTTSVLAGMLVGDDLNAYSEEIYNRIYKVEIFEKDNKLEILNSDFECSE